MHISEGLTTSKAEELLIKYGKNEISSTKRFSYLQIFLSQFKNFLIVLLLVAALISFFVGEALDAVFILVIIVLNALLGFFQEYKAENALAALRDMTISKVRVVRDGVEAELDSRLLVPGDIVMLTEGDKVPADALILDSLHAEINEASLTGESLPVEKNPHNKDQNTLFMGTIVTSGKATARVTQTGFSTTFGKMAASLSEIEREQTPLMRKIAVLGKQLSIGAIGITSLIFVIGILQGRDFVEMLQISISLAVAVIPEGLPAVITITLAIGLQRMAKQKAILRKLGAIEGLGNTTVIATDKTGTLTENKMRVAKFWMDGTTFTPDQLAGKQISPLLSMLLKTGIICNNASLVSGKDKNTVEILGDPTEGSLLLLSKELSVDPRKVKEEGKLVDEFAFDAKKKMMSVVWEENGNRTLYAKGAPETIVTLTTTLLDTQGKRSITKKDHESIQEELKNYQKKGLRVLAIAKRDDIQKIGKRDAMEKDLTFIGFVGIADPARTGVKDVLISTKHAGIHTIMVTGDNPLTAASIGEQIGLLDGNDRVVTGVELAKMSDRELDETVESIRVFARTTPEDKFRIVKALQKKGHVVTVTGDGVNDALALKKADVGVAMGITGTDVAKEVADMVITDDNFVSIVRAVREGRIIFNNIVKSITYLISCDLGEVIAIFAAIALGLPAPLLPIQILWVNLVTDGLPALSLAFDDGHEGIMQRHQHHNGTLLSRQSLAFIIPMGLLIGILTILSFVLTYSTIGESAARTIAFTTLVGLQMAVVFVVRDGAHPFSNKLLLASVAISIILHIIVITVPPFTTIFNPSY